MGEREELRDFLKKNNKFTGLSKKDRDRVCAEYLGNAQAALHFTELVNCLNEEQHDKMSQASELIDEVRREMANPADKPDPAPPPA